MPGFKGVCVARVEVSPARARSQCIAGVMDQRVATMGPEAGFGSMGSSHYPRHCREPLALSLWPNSLCSGASG